VTFSDLAIKNVCNNTLKGHLEVLKFRNFKNWFQICNQRWSCDSTRLPCVFHSFTTTRLPF